MRTAIERIVSSGSTYVQSDAIFARIDFHRLPVPDLPGEQGAGSISQGYLENANVQAVQEMVDMITTQRAYEMNSKTIQTADQMLQRLTQLH